MVHFWKIVQVIFKIYELILGSRISPLLSYFFSDQLFTSHIYKEDQKTLNHSANLNTLMN